MLGAECVSAKGKARVRGAGFGAAAECGPHPACFARRPSPTNGCGRGGTLRLRRARRGSARRERPPSPALPQKPVGEGRPQRERYARHCPARPASSPERGRGSAACRGFRAVRAADSSAHHHPPTATHFATRTGISARNNPPPGFFGGGWAGGAGPGGGRCGARDIHGTRTHVQVPPSIRENLAPRRTSVACRPG